MRQGGYRHYQRNPYTKLKTELSPSRELRARQLLATEEIGDRKPSQFPRHLRSIWLGRLPPNVRTHLAGRPEIDLDTAPNVSWKQLALRPSAAYAKQRLDDLCSRVDQLTTTTSTGTDYSGAALLADPCPGMALHQRHALGPMLEGVPSLAHTNPREDEGSRCQRRHTPPPQARADSWSTQGPTSVFFLPQCRSRVNYDLCAANGTTIPTYGWLPLSLNLGLRRYFTLKAN
jgi:hypothetical protein